LCCSAHRPPHTSARPEAADGAAWRIVTLADQWSRFIEDVPADEPPVLSRAHFDEWGERYLDSDPGSRARDPIGVKVPTGPFDDIRHAWHGEFPYDPGWCAPPSPSSAANGTGSFPTPMRAGCSMA
jgi:hypothetical protein